MYADDNDGQYTPRMDPFWPERLLSYYLVSNLVFCPNDKLREVNRSYLVNGFNDWFKEVLGTNYVTFENHMWPEGMKESAIREPVDTILFGEKAETSHNYHVDLIRPYPEPPDCYKHIEDGRHNATVKGRGGGANYVFADGGVRYLGFGKAVNPIILWAVTDAWR